MSYPYDINPWDDNYNPNASQQQPQQQPVSSGGWDGYSDGYNNNSNNNRAGQYSDMGGAGQQQLYQYQDPQQQQQQQQYTNDEQATQEQAQGAPQESALSRFLRRHVPLCGSIMDTVGGINLPFIDALVQHVNRDLLVSKIFYFFFYSAFGSLFPLMGVYFKQLGMNPAQVGILTGVRPFIEIFSAPFWNSLAERFHKSKALLLFSLLSWIVFTYSLAHIRPPASACVAFNDTYYVLYTPYSANDLSNADVGQLEETNEASKGNEMFMNKMPSAQQEISKEREGKDQILASEENQNDQRRKRRRRKRRQATIEDAQESEGGKKRRYFYNVGDSKDDGYESQNLDLDVDLENDFDDKLISQTAAAAASSERGKPNQAADHHRPGSYFFEHDTEADSDASEYDELEQLYSKRESRYKRAARTKDTFDLLVGEGDDSWEEPESKEETPVRGRGASKGKAGEKDTKEEEGNEEEEGGEGEEGEGSGGNGSGSSTTTNNNKDRGTGKYNQQPVGTNSTATAATTTEMPYNSPSTTNQEGNVVNKTKRVYKQRHKTPPTHIVGMSPITVEYAVNYNKEKHRQFVTPMFSTIVYKLDDIKEVFFLLLLLISLGEFFSAPALTLADSATLGYLGENTDLYGRQRMFGSFSWAVTLLLVGMALDNATSIADHPCGPHQRERSYTVCFIIFSLLMACAFLTATQFRFNYPKSVAGGNQALVASTTDNNTVVTTSVDAYGDSYGAGNTGNIDELYASTQPRSIFNTAPPVNEPPPNVKGGGSGKEKFEFLDKWKSAVFAQRTGELPEWVNVFRQFRNSLHLMYLFITWFLGCGVGLVFTFLFWHLQDVGGTPTLFGICSVINHISEILAYFFSFSVIKRFGHTRVLSVGLGCNVIRFLYVAFLTNPYYALPFELVQGITHAACFAACCSYISHVSRPELRTSTQGVMQGLHHGIGRACGALLGGYMINAIGSRASFCIYGLLSGCVLAGFLYVRRKASQSEDEEVRVDDSEALGGYGAPQGVPSTIPGKVGQNV